MIKTMTKTMTTTMTKREQYRLAFRAVFQTTVLTISLFTVGCQGDNERQEKISKLRALGVTVTPFVTELADEGGTKIINMEVLAVAPKGETITVESFTDVESKYALPVSTVIKPGSEVYTEKAKFNLFQVTATTQLPSKAKVTINPKIGFLPVRFALMLQSDSKEQEKIVGDIVTFAPGREELNWLETPPLVTITSLSEGDTISSEVELKAEIVDPNGEEFRIGWYTSSGTIINRKAISTKWKEIESGAQTIIVTARGTKTSSFAWQAIDVIVE
jgi:hypothetical protein